MDYESLPKSRKDSIIIEVKEFLLLTTSHETSLSERTGFAKNSVTDSEVAEIFVRENICHQPLRGSFSIKEAGSLIISECIPESKTSLQPTLCRTGKMHVGDKRRTEMWLPSFSALGIDSLILPGKPQHHNKRREAGIPPPKTAFQADIQQHSSDLCSQTLEIVPLPTPPDDVPFTWEFKHRNHIAIESLAASSHQAAQTSHRVTSLTAESTSNRPPSIPLPPYGDTDESGGLPSTWLDRAIGKLLPVSSRDDVVWERHLAMVVQASPSQAKFPLAKPVFQQVVEALQQQSANAPYILITHAVSQVVSMEEIPASPPATPNTISTSDEYFDQTIFTHAALIPSYHAPSSVAPLAKLHANGINAPASTHVSILERYIPPTTKQEVEDFFSTRRSHLVDRLTELSPNNGTLLLIYPTAAGARTFAHDYLGPIIEPFLRQFCLLNNLTSDAATRLGKVAALSATKDFGSMTHALQDLCSRLMEGASADREPRSGYHVIHAESASITIERRTWIQWFVEQEAIRLKQDIVEYQKAGGRMSARDFGNTPGSLVREVIDGIRNSKETTGGEIEVGVYVIRRSMV